MQEQRTASRDDVVDAVLGASRALVAVAARSLATAESEVSLPQYRALVVLASRGPQRSTDLAEELGVHGSTAGRMCDRLVRKGLVQRDRSAEDRRTVRLALTARGRALVDDVTARRRSEISRLVRRVPTADRAPLVAALEALSRAAGEVPEQDWSTGWRL
jgi:DNA-binding MarR family transcriptional regulator